MKRFVHWSPAAYAIMVLPIGTLSRAEVLVRNSPVAAHCPPPDGMSMFIRPDSSQHMTGHVNGVAVAARL